MHGHGLLSGDVHAHLPSPKDAALQMRAEDVRVVNLLALSGSDFPANSAFTGRLDEASGGGYDISVSQEVQEWQVGHLTLLGLRSLVPGYPNPGGTLEYWTSNPHWDIGRAARAAREQGGFVSWSHFENLPGSYSPVGRRARPPRRRRAHDLGRSLAAPGALEPVERLRPTAGRVHGDAGRGPLLSVPERGLPAPDRCRDGQGRRRHARWAATGRTSPRDHPSATRAGSRASRPAGASSRTRPMLEFEVDGHGARRDGRAERRQEGHRPPAAHARSSPSRRSSSCRTGGRWPGRSCRSRPIPRSTASTR